MYWKIVAKSEKWIPFDGFLGQVKIEGYERDSRFKYKGALFTCYVETDDEIEAEEMAKATFDQALKSLIMTSDISYYLEMATPIQVEISEVDNRALITDTPSPVLKSYLVRPFVGYALPLFSISEANRWLDLIGQLNEPWAKRVVDLYCLGIRLKDISDTAAYMQFIRIIELFINRIYRELFESETPKRDRNPGQEMDFKEELRRNITKHCPDIDASKIEKLVGDLTREIFVPYSNKELLRYVCSKSGFFDHVLDSKRKWLKRQIDEVYSYWPEEKRKQHVEEIYNEHEKFINTASLDLFDVRVKAAHVTSDSDTNFISNKDFGAFSISIMLSRYLIDMLVEGRIQLH